MSKPDGMPLHDHFQFVRNIIHQGKAHALQAVNTQLIWVNWQLGAYLSTRLTSAAYGNKIVEQLAQWLQSVEPGLKGFDKRSLYHKKQFFEVWQAFDYTLLPDSLSTNIISEKHINNEKKIVVSPTPQSFDMPEFLSNLPWTHHVEILRQVTMPEEIAFYVVLSIKERYTVRELRRQIQSGLFERQMLAKRDLILPQEHPQHALIPEIFRNHYIFEFLDLKDPYSEYDLQKALLRRMKEFLLELGRDFIFLEEEMCLKVGRWFGRRKLSTNVSQKLLNTHMKEIAATLSLAILAVLASMVSCGQNTYRSGEKIYKTNCANCHLDQGEGLGALIPPLAGSDYLSAHRDRLACIVRYGLQDTIVVNGQVYAEKMAGNAALSEVQITNVLNYVLQSWGNKHEPLTFEEVKKSLSNCK